MKRTTMTLPDDVLARLRYEARRRGSSVAELVREAVELHVPEPRADGRLGSFGVGEAAPSMRPSGSTST